MVTRNNIPYQKEAYSIPRRELQLLSLGRLHYSGRSWGMPPPLSDPVPTSGPRQVRQQANPLTQ